MLEPSQLFYFRYPLEYHFKGKNDHWNDAGQKYAANIVAKLIADKIKN